MAVVRLDPWQNIVGVGWSDGGDGGNGNGNGGGGPDGDGFPGVIGAMARATVFPHSGTTLDLDQPENIEGGFPAVGDLLIAQLGGSIVSDPFPELTISGPAGWTELYHRSVEEIGVFFGSAGVWSRYVEAGDPMSWTWTLSHQTGRQGSMLWISGARQSGFPADWGVTVIETGIPAHPVVAPSITPGFEKTLLLAFMNSADNFNNANYQGTAAQSLEIAMSNSKGNGHFQAAFSEKWAGPGATGTRTVTVADTNDLTITGHVAIAPPAP